MGPVGYRGLEQANPPGWEAVDTLGGSGHHRSVVTLSFVAILPPAKLKNRNKNNSEQAITMDGGEPMRTLVESGHPHYSEQTNTIRLEANTDCLRARADCGWARAPWLSESDRYGDQPINMVGG